ncbi:MAG: hypothetical protein ACREHE_13990 [Rhizomicrobium sp.]
MGRRRAAIVGGAALALLLAAPPASAAEDAGLARLALCRDSWLDWKTDPARIKTFGDRFHGAFTRNGNDPYFVPKSDVSVAGLRVLEAFPDSVGMGVGFSLLVDAPFGKARAIVEHELGKPLGKCDASDGMHACELDIADKRTVTLMAQDNMPGKTLVGCYYYYEK